MIYYECNVGYIPDITDWRQYKGRDISEVTITDASKYLGICTTYTRPFTKGKKNVSEFITECYAVFGEDFYKTWLVPFGSDGYWNSAERYGWVPSARYMYPGIWNAVGTAISSGQEIFPIIIFPKLNKAISSDGIFIITDNKFTIVESNLWSVFYTNQGYHWPIIMNYTSGMNLNTATWGILEAFVNTSDERSSQVKTDGYYPTGAINLMRWLLSTNPKPDKVDPSLDDPYGPGGDIKPGGGEGDFDNTSDPIDFPPMPTLSAVDTGFLTLFNPSLAQLQELSRYMWSDLFDVEGWKKLFANPMDAILGLTIVPVAVPEAGTGVVSVGNISTGISMTKAAGQYVDVDCGTLNVNEYWGAYLDYDPYTKAEIYLPFIGIHALSTDDIMQKPVHVKYRIDLLSGACCAYVKCGNSVLYSFVGQCSSAVPTTSSDWTNIINGALSIAGSIGSMVATGGASAPMTAGAIASAAVNSLKPNIEKSGSMGGMGGMLGVQQPYIILTRPRQALPPKLSSYTGFPSFMTKVLGDLSGFTIIDSIHLENIPATGAELSEIEALLKEGVIL